MSLSKMLPTISSMEHPWRYITAQGNSDRNAWGTLREEVSRDRQKLCRPKMSALPDAPSRGVTRNCVTYAAIDAEIERD